MPYVTGSEILDLVGKGDPSAADTAWADTVADAIDAAITARLDGTTPSAGFTAELTRSALIDGAAAYAERRAPQGVLSLGDAGEVTRLGADVLRSTGPVLRRHLDTAGVGIG